MRIIPAICRFALGLGFVIFGANILVPFLPMPPLPEGSLTSQFMAVMKPSHWMFLVGSMQLTGGLLVLLGGTAPLGLLVLAPVLVNILAFHIFLENGNGLLPGLILSSLEIYLLYAYRAYYRPLLTTKARPL